MIGQPPSVRIFRRHRPVGLLWDAPMLLTVEEERLRMPANSELITVAR